MSDDITLLRIEQHHEAALAEAAAFEALDEDRSEEALKRADGFASAAADQIATSLFELGAKARVLNRQAGGNVELVIGAGAVAERRLIASILREAARLLPKRSGPPVRGSRARLTAAGLDESPGGLQDHRSSGA